MPIEREVVDRCSSPRGVMQLQKRGQHFEIISNGVFLMATHNGASERRLVTEALAAATNPRRVLIGGLGVGFSLGAALADSRVSHVTVVEIEERLIAWNRTELAPFSGYGLDDPRTQLVNANLVEWLSQTPAGFDIICIDIDNGPDWLVSETNRALYEDAGLSAVRRRLAPGGAATFWSAAASSEFLDRLRRHFAVVEVITVSQERGPDYIYVAKQR